MQGLTFIVAAAASLLVLVLSPLFGLIVYIATLAWYPQYLSIPIGTAAFTACRIVILVIFAKLFLGTNLPSRFKFILLDKLVVLYFIAAILVGATTAKSFSVFLENRAGALFDMLLPYFAVRIILQNRKQYLTMLKGVLVIALPLAVVGLYQCVTGDNPVGFMQQFSEWASEYKPLARGGFYRANVTFSVSIMYGLFFAMFGAVCAGLLHSDPKHRLLYWVGLGFMCVGIFASMSSGPVLAGLLSILFILFYRWRKYWKLIVALIVVMCLSIEIISNRHFYDVLGGFTFDSATAWYRSRLIDVGLFQGGMSGHWLRGFGESVDPGWNVLIDGRDHTDMVNHYLLILSGYGLIGFIPFLAMNVAVGMELVKAYRNSMTKEDRWLIWCLSAAMIGLWNAFMTVSLFDQTTTIYFMLIAFSGVMSTVVAGDTARILTTLRKRFKAFASQRVGMAHTE